MGFDKSRPEKNVNDIDIDSILNEDLDNHSSSSESGPSSGVNDEQIEETKSPRPKSPRNGKSNSNSTPVNQKTVIIGCSAIVLALLALTIGIASSKSKTPKTASVQPATVTQQQTDSNKKAGIDNLQSDTQHKNTSSVESSDNLTTDLNGKAVPSDYQIKTIKTVTEVVGYTKHRVVLGNGLEFYYLDVDYKGQPYKVQIPFAMFKELSSDTGYVVVDAEDTTTTTNQELITYMAVRKDQKSYLDKVGK